MNKEVPEDAVLILIARRQDEGPRVDVSMRDWWKHAADSERAAMLRALVETLGQLRDMVLPPQTADGASGTSPN